VDIFEKHGEDYFREKEALMLRKMIDHNDCIIATGGGAPCFNNNMQWMNDHGFTIYLSAGPQYLLENVMNEKDKRPLINKLNKAELLFFIEQKLKERLPYYQQAKKILPVTDIYEQSWKQILKIIKKK
jgi:shikimate kinase